MLHYGNRAETKVPRTFGASQSHMVAMAAFSVRVLELDQGFKPMFTTARSARLKRTTRTLSI